MVNFVVLTSAASACNSGVFSTSRLLYSLAKRNHAPGILEILTSKQVPANALFLSVLVICLVVALQYVVAEGVFVIISSVSTFCFLYIWGIITICHMKFIRKRPDLAAKSVFKMPLFPFLNYLVLAFFASLLLPWPLIRHESCTLCNAGMVHHVAFDLSVEKGNCIISEQR